MFSSSLESVVLLTTISPVHALRSSQQKIRSHEQLKTQLRGDIHIRHALAIAVFLAVVEIFDDLFQHDAADVFEVADSRLGFGEVACHKETLSVRGTTERKENIVIL